MSKFLNLLEEFDPRNNGDPKWKLIDFLKSKGINVSLVKNTDMIYIDTGKDTITVNVSQPEEEAESINAGTGTYEVDKEVYNLADTAKSGPLGIMAKKWGTAPQLAKAAVAKRKKLLPVAVKAFDAGTTRIEKGLQAVKQSAINSTY